MGQRRNADSSVDIGSLRRVIIEKPKYGMGNEERINLSDGNPKVFIILNVLGLERNAIPSIASPEQKLNVTQPSILFKLSNSKAKQKLTIKIIINTSINV